MLFLMASANRDDRRFADGDRFDIHRKPVKHLTFGIRHPLLPGRGAGTARGPDCPREVLKRFPEWEIDTRQRPDGVGLGRQGMGHASRVHPLTDGAIVEAPIAAP